jgi:hypothetical protein
MSGTRRTPIGRRSAVQITRRAIDLFAELERARRARRRAVDCTISERGLCTTDCRACRRWFDLHDELHIQLGLPPWVWPCLPRNPYPPGSPKAREWRPGPEQKELWDLLNEARAGAPRKRPAVSARKEEEGTNAEPAGTDASI